MKEDDVALTLVHTADWHLGMRFRGFRPDDERELMRARLDVIERIFGVADRHQADAVLCAGDLFDGPRPEPQWWEGLADVLVRRAAPSRPVFLLPGNHDPLIPESVWDAGSPFRRKIPAHVHVVDRDDYSFPLKEGAVLCAAPCRSSAGQSDLALSLPKREISDERIRVGLVHGSTFDMPDCQMSFPIAQDAVVQRGFDYLAIGDTHGFREVPPGARPPTVYPGAPEPTSFADTDPGYVAVVFITQRRRLRLDRERVARWQWETVQAGSLEDLRRLAARTDLAQRVVQLTVNARLPAAEYEEAERLLAELSGSEAVRPKVGILRLDRKELKLDTRDLAAVFADLPDAIREAARRLLEEERGTNPDVARRALTHLYALVRRQA